MSCFDFNYNRINYPFARTSFLMRFMSEHALHETIRDTFISYNKWLYGEVG